VERVMSRTSSSITTRSSTLTTQSLSPLTTVTRTKCLTVPKKTPPLYPSATFKSAEFLGKFPLYFFILCISLLTLCL
jgi:hypothetical protein